MGGHSAGCGLGINGKRHKSMVIGNGNEKPTMYIRTNYEMVEHVADFTCLDDVIDNGRRDTETSRV